MTIPWQPGYQGATVTPPGYVDPHSYVSAWPLQLVATTGTAGFALQNATPTILSWPPPSDGQLHRALLIVTMIVATNETGGQVNFNFTDPGGTSRNRTVFAAGLTAGFQSPSAQLWTLQAGAAVSLSQGTALTAGAATLWAEIWGS